MKNDSSKRVVEVKNKKFTFGAIIIIVLSSLVFFGFQAFSEATYKYYSVNEILGSGSVDSNTQIGLKAVLVPNSYVRSADGLSATFNVKDKDNENGSTLEWFLGFLELEALTIKKYFFNVIKSLKVSIFFVRNTTKLSGFPFVNALVLH